MIAVISPAKTLDFETSTVTNQFSNPVFVEQAGLLVETLKKKSPKQLQELMSISENLAELNAERYAAWKKEPQAEFTKPAVLAFKGDVYLGLEAETFSEEDFSFAQQHLRILSGLYGLLKPLDLIQPYRLEMGTKLKVKSKPDLYGFWGTTITEKLQEELNAEKQAVLVNLASNEYFKSVLPKKLKAEIITPVFKDLKNGQYKVISFYAKKARGMMAAYFVKNKLAEPEQLKSFDLGGYRFNPELSKGNDWVFTRDAE